MEVVFVPAQLNGRIEAYWEATLYVGHGATPRIYVGHGTSKRLAVLAAIDEMNRHEVIR